MRAVTRQLKLQRGACRDTSSWPLRTCYPHAQWHCSKTDDCRDAAKMQSTKKNAAINTPKVFAWNTKLALCHFSNQCICWTCATFWNRKRRTKPTPTSVAFMPFECHMKLPRNRRNITCKTPTARDCQYNVLHRNSWPLQRNKQEINSMQIENQQERHHNTNICWKQNGASRKLGNNSQLININELRWTCAAPTSR